MKNKIKINIVKQIDGYYKVKVKGVGEILDYIYGKRNTN